MPSPRLPMVRRSLRNLFSRPATRRYPSEVRPRYAGARGTIEFDELSCVHCGLCARRCPTAALTVSREERTFTIEQLRCIACGVCVEVCNKQSLRMSVEAPRIRTRAEVGPDGRRPGRQTWHKEEPAVVGPAAMAEPATAAAAV
jgi:formate hydrogenlyase subunit 6/NADH:ubiquinone oxidoreductase subunit I